MIKNHKTIPAAEQRERRDQFGAVLLTLRNCNGAIKLLKLDESPHERSESASGTLEQNIFLRLMDYSDVLFGKLIIHQKAFNP